MMFEEPGVERPPARLVVAGEHPIHAWWRVLEGLTPGDMPQAARHLLGALIAECVTNADGKILGAVSVRQLAHSTGMSLVEVRNLTASLERRDWLVRLEERVGDPAVATAYHVRLDGRRWRRGDRQ